jgi:hypothetical protein
VVAVWVVLATVALSGSLAARQLHVVCSAQQHHCPDMATIVSCCCGDQDAARHDAVPVQSRVEAQSVLTVLPPLAVDTAASLQPLAPMHDHTSPAHLALLDLPTLFESFLI